MGYRVYVKNKKNKPYDPKTGIGDTGHWPEKKKLEVLSTFLATGSTPLAAAICKVPQETIRHWKKQPWWQERIKDIKNEENLQLDSRLSKILDKSLDAVLDRIENGEAMYDPRTGEIRRVPAKLRDVQKVASDMVDKKQLLTKVQKAKEQDKQQITADHLVQLAKEFAKFATGKEPKDIEDVKSVYEGEHTEIFEELGVEIANGVQKEEGDDTPQT